MWPERHARDDRGAGGDEADRDVDALAAVGGPVDVLEVQQQGQLVDDHCVRGTERDRRRGVAPLLLGSAQADGSHRRQHRDADVVVVKVPAAQLIPPPAGPWPARIQWVSARSPAKVRVNDTQASTVAC